MPKEIIQVGHPTLRQPARALSKEEILSDEIQNLIASMIEIMHAAPGVGLAAPQIGVSLQIVVMEDRPEYTANAPAEQLKLKERTPFPLHVLINPSLKIGKEEIEFFEGCLSVEGLISLVPRSLEVVVEGLNEKAEPIKIEARGWYARILQHEIDHLRGILCIDRMKPRTLMKVDNYLQYWADKDITAFCDHLPPLI